MLIKTSLVSGFTVRTLLDKLPVIDLDPPYQREGNVWSKDQKARLIDTMVNDLDMPKLYFQRLNGYEVDPATGFTIQYAVLDGKQRLEAITDFIAGDVSLPDDFIFYEDEGKAAAGMDCDTLVKSYPDLAERILSYELPIVQVFSNSGDLVEEMFQRLNTATALNAAEKRNAISGKAREASNELAEHAFFLHKVAIRNARYKYRELSTKFLVFEDQLENTGGIRDSKASTLMDFFVKSHNGEISDEIIEIYRTRVAEVLDRMVQHFEDDDRLLRSVGTLMVYYLAFRDTSFGCRVDRRALVQFEEMRRNVEAQTPRNDSAADVLRRYNAFVQSTNDGTALEYRVEVLKAFIASDNKPDPDDLPGEVLDLNNLEESQDL